MRRGQGGKEGNKEWSRKRMKESIWNRKIRREREKKSIRLRKRNKKDELE
jgi:hypothetical protein